LKEEARRNILNRSIELGVKHLGDSYCGKPQIFCPNASPSWAIESETQHSILNEELGFREA
jgi:hypothetical protein